MNVYHHHHHRYRRRHRLLHHNQIGETHCELHEAKEFNIVAHTDELKTDTRHRHISNGFMCETRTIFENVIMNKLSGKIEFTQKHYVNNNVL